MGRKSKSKNVGVKKCIQCNENVLGVGFWYYVVLCIVDVKIQRLTVKSYKKQLSFNYA